MKKYFKPALSVISVLSESQIAATFTGFESFGDFSESNIASYTVNSATIGHYSK